MMFIGCKDDDVASGSFDPSQPVEFKDFSPKEGQVRTRLYIYGKNFGTDETKIHVNVGGKEAKVIGSTGEIIYCMVGKRSYDGTVTVTIDDKDGKPAATKTFDEKFNYIPKTTVGTLLRKVDESGNSSYSYGSFDGEASAPANDWLVFDPKYAEIGGDRILFAANWHDGLRVLNLTQRTHTRLSRADNTLPCSRSHSLPTATRSYSPTTTDRLQTRQDRTCITACARKDSRKCVPITTDRVPTALYACLTAPSSTPHGPTHAFTAWRTLPERYPIPT